MLQKKISICGDCHCLYKAACAILIIVLNIEYDKVIDFTYHLKAREEIYILSELSVLP